MRLPAYIFFPLCGIVGFGLPLAGLYLSTSGVPGWVFGVIAIAALAAFGWWFEVARGRDLASCSPDAAGDESKQEGK